MIFKALILLIALSYVQSSPLIDKNELDNKLANEDVLKKELPVALPKIPTTEEETITEKRSARIARNNKVEYVYVNANGEIVQPIQSAPAKEFHRVINSESLPYPSNAESYPTTLLKNNPTNEKLLITGRSSAAVESVPEYKLDEKLDSPASLQYAAGNIKIRQENLKTRSGLTNAGSGLSQQQQQQNSPLISNFIPPYYSNSPLISSPYSSYPLSYPLLLQNAFNPLLNNGLFSNQYASQSYFDPLISSGSLLNRAVSSGGLNYLNPIEPVGNYLYGRQFNPIGLSPAYSSQYLNPFLSYLPQTSNFNYLLNRGSNLIGLNGFNGFNGLNGYDGLYSPYNYLYPSSYSPYLSNSIYSQPIYSGLYPNNFQSQYNYPLNNQQQTLLPSTVPIPDNTGFVSRRVATAPTVVSTTTSTNVEPFSDTVVAPASVYSSPTSNSPSVIIPGNVETSSSSSTESNEKPLLYSNQNAALRTHSSIYDSGYFNGGSYLNSPYYNRIDPLTGQPIYNRYPYGSPYSRFSSYYGPNSGYSSIYRPGYIGTYPPNNYFNNQIGMLPFNSPMHYSAVDSSNNLLSRSGDKIEDGKATVVGKDQSKESNLMYTIKTSKSESKETVSRLNNQETPKGLLDDKKA